MMRFVNPRGLILAAMMFASGCAALIYEIVWFQSLMLVMGASAISLAILLTSFMGGLTLGSVFLPRWIPARHHPLKVYAALEVAIGGYGLLLAEGLPWLGRWYCAWATPGMSDLPLRGFWALVLLVPPTTLMGATFPVMARWVGRTSTGRHTLGWLYAANTLGATGGCLLAGLFLLPQFDSVMASFAAVFLNLAIALSAWMYAVRSSVTGEACLPAIERSGAANSSPMVLGVLDRHLLAVTALSGLTALGCETVWTRLLSLLFGPTTYTFSLLLAVFLTGLASGSGLVAIWLRRGRDLRQARAALGLMQWGLALAIPLTALIITRVLPGWLAARDLQAPVAIRLGLDLWFAVVTLIVPTLLWGASFPLALYVAVPLRPTDSTTGDSSSAADLPASVNHSAPSADTDEGVIVGWVSGANTIGAITGSLLTGLILVPMLGTEWTQRGFAMLAWAAGCIALWPWLEASLTTMLSNGVVAVPRPVRQWGLIAAGVVMAGLVGQSVPSVPLGMLAWGHKVDDWNTIKDYRFVREGLDSTILIEDSTLGYRCFHICGKVEASNSPSDKRTQRLLGHLPALTHGTPRKVLVVGCGSGMTSGAFLLHPSVEEIVLCEMETAVIEASRDNFRTENHGVLHDPRLRIVHDDARHFLATTQETFDVITTDPIHPWVRGAATLYTEEFLTMCRNHLRPAGVVTLWVPLYESQATAVRCELATFLKVFPNALVWSGETSYAYDVIAVASRDDEPLDSEVVLRRLYKNGLVQADLADAGIRSREELRQRSIARGEDLLPYLVGAPINRDRNLRLQYLAGLTPDGKEAQQIFDTMRRLGEEGTHARRLAADFDEP